MGVILKFIVLVSELIFVFICDWVFRMWVIWLLSLLRMVVVVISVIVVFGWCLSVNLIVVSFV